MDVPLAAVDPNRNRVPLILQCLLQLCVVTTKPVNQNKLGKSLPDEPSASLYRQVRSAHSPSHPGAFYHPDIQQESPYKHTLEKHLAMVSAFGSIGPDPF
jgi:hypothetical protein